jgi:hypothetical protein
MKSSLSIFILASSILQLTSQGSSANMLLKNPLYQHADLIILCEQREQNKKRRFIFKKTLRNRCKIDIYRSLDFLSYLDINKTKDHLIWKTLHTSLFNKEGISNFKERLFSEDKPGKIKTLLIFFVKLKYIFPSTKDKTIRERYVYYKKMIYGKPGEILFTNRDKNGWGVKQAWFNPQAINWK